MNDHISLPEKLKALDEALNRLLDEPATGSLRAASDVGARINAARAVLRGDLRVETATLVWTRDAMRQSDEEPSK